MPTAARRPPVRRPPADVAALLGDRIQAPTSAVDRVAEALREQIDEGALAPGTQLTEESLASAMRVSRNTVREAYAVLVADRVAVRVPNRGVFVAEPDVAAVRDLYAVRLLVEPAALRWGTGLTDDLVAAMREEVDRAVAARDARDWIGVATANQHVHRLVVRAGGSQRVQAFFSSVLAEMRLVFHRAGGAFHDPFVEDNLRVVELLEQGRREDAAEAMSDYLRRACDALVDALEDRVS